MGIDLIGRGGASLNRVAWGYCLDIAVAFGWQPAGIVAPPDCAGEWSGTYITSDLQAVTDDDARTLGAALRRAVTALRTEQNLTEEQAKAWDVVTRIIEADSADPFGSDSDGTFVDLVCELADYAEKGGFEIN